MTLSQQFVAYSEWRSHLSNGLSAYRKWLSENELSDAQTDLRMGQLLEKLHEDRLHVAFVAEFSRGKSELINAIFFADYGSRMLPSTAGRTTMCPTELMYDSAKPPSIELLPIQTRETNASISEYKHLPKQWATVPLNVESAESMQEALRSVSEIDRVTPEVAEKYGFFVGDKESSVVRVAEDGMVEIPRWRHAIINFPHPLLKQGLVILDTPGLNAIGTEPELTLSLLPNAHAVLFVLAADTGVTQSDLAVWNEHIGTPGRRKRGRLVVLNKIDSMWDELKSEDEVNAEITKQTNSCAWTLELPSSQIFPISAQKGLVAKINSDAALLKRSRLPELELALSQELIPAKQEIVHGNTDSEFSDINMRMRGLLESRLAGLREQLGELNELRGKNKGVVEYMIGKVRVEKEEFEAGLQRYYAVRSVFSQLSNELFALLGLDSLKMLTDSTRETMRKAKFSTKISEAMKNMFVLTRTNLIKSDDQITEIINMMTSVYKKFSVEHGLKLSTPTTFSMTRYLKDLDRLEYWCDTHLNTMLQLLLQGQGKVTQKFFDEVAHQVRRSFERANRDSESWLKSVMSPMDTQVREHQAQLKRRLESIKRIHEATDTLEDRIGELGHAESDLLSQIVSLETLSSNVQNILAQTVGRRSLRNVA
jgi:hypothetical protein